MERKLRVEVWEAECKILNSLEAAVARIADPKERDAVKRIMEGVFKDYPVSGCFVEGGKIDVCRLFQDFMRLRNELMEARLQNMRDGDLFATVFKSLPRVTSQGP